LRKVIWDLESAGIRCLYNVDLHPVQRYFFQPQIEWVGRFTVDYDDNSTVETISAEPDETTPPLRAKEMEFTSDEETLKASLLSLDHEILTIQGEHRPLLYALLRKLGILSPFSLRPSPGSIIVDSESFQDLGIGGLWEKSGFAGLPIGVVANWGPARVIDSRQCHEAIKRGILIPRTRTGSAKNVLTAKEIAFTDRGALILSPRVGLHENVAELDFESLFPAIIIKHNVSYETVSAEGVISSKGGLLPKLAEQFVQRRLYFKHMKKHYDEGSPEFLEYEQRDALLKKLLVCIFGYSGSDLNRFGNAFAYREINRIGRETVVKAMNIALRDGFEVIYLDTDSIFVQRKEGSFDDFNQLADRITLETGFRILVANHYRYLVLLTQEADPEIEAARRFYGKLVNGRVYYRGIELRRRDYPRFLKEYQQKLLETLLEAETASDITSKQVHAAIQLTQEALEIVQSGDMPVSELVISKVLRMPIERYRSLFPHVLAAVQLRQNKQSVRPGDSVEYVYTDMKQVNPMNRVVPAQFATTYDSDKYAEMLLDVAESILGVFGFTRTQLGFQIHPRNFLEELRGERMKEIMLELESLQPDAHTVT
jgi:DNA polymerase elongation subunit (family B)